MYQVLAILSGVLVALMVSFNSLLSSEIGATKALVIIHIVGLITIIIYMIITATKPKSIKKIHPLFLTAGAVGVINIFLSNMSFLTLGAALTVGLGLYGQLFMSAIVDHLGLFGKTINKITIKKALSLGLMAVGIMIMIIW